MALAAVAWYTAGVLQRQLTLETKTQVFGRAVFAGAALLAYVAVVERGRVVQAFRSIGRAGIAVALCVATASGSFISALNHTSVARVLFILALAPVLAALLARVTLGEAITPRTVVAMALALAGVAVMLWAPGAGCARVWITIATITIAPPTSVSVLGRSSSATHTHSGPSTTSSSVMRPT